MKLAVRTVHREYTFEVTPKTRIREIFQLLCKTLETHEIWYFGLMYYGPDNEEMYVEQSKKTLKDLKDNISKLQFRVKHYPVDVGKELIEPSTIELFFLQAESSIVKDEIFCPADTCVLLASYALQAKHGDYNSYEHDEETLAKHKLLPDRLTKQASMSMSEWHRDIIRMWGKHSRLDKEHAMLEYLKLAQKLDMYGVTYYRVKNKEKTDLFFGVTINGINIYEERDRSKPTMSIPWSEIRNMSFNDKKFILKFNDTKAKDFAVYTENVKICKCVLSLAMGGHFLHMRRAQPEPPEITQIREMAKQARRNKNF